MGRKRSRAWKYIYICFTGLISLSLFNCTTLRDISQQMKAREHLCRANHLLAQRDYEGALKDYQKVLSVSARKSQDAEALFNIGLIYAHFEYPKKNYEKSLNCFSKILKDYPESPLVEQARVWAGVLQEHERLDKLIDKSKLAVKGLDKVMRPEEYLAAREHILRGERLLAQGDYEGSLHEIQKVLLISPRHPPEEEALFNLALIYAHHGNPQKDYQKSLDFFRKLIKDYPGSLLTEQAKIWIELLQENNKLNQVIQKLKQVDIEIEERKRGK